LRVSWFQSRALKRESTKGAIKFFMVIGILEACFFALHAKSPGIFQFSLWPVIPITLTLVMTVFIVYFIVKLTPV
jgi:hypothetical protein